MVRAGDAAVKPLGDLRCRRSHPPYRDGGNRKLIEESCVRLTRCHHPYEELDHTEEQTCNLKKLDDDGSCVGVYSGHRRVPMTLPLKPASTPLSPISRKPV